MYMVKKKKKKKKKKIKKNKNYYVKGKKKKKKKKLNVGNVTKNLKKFNKINNILYYHKSKFEVILNKIK